MTLTTNPNNNQIISCKAVRDVYLAVGETKRFDLIDYLIKDIKNLFKENKIVTSNVTKHTDFKSLAANPFFHEIMKDIQPTIQKFYPRPQFEIREVWGNIYSNSKDYAKTHCHQETSAFCGVLYCTDGPGPGTYFKDFDLLVPEKKGRFVLFSPLALHEVKPFDYEKERITIAWNFFEVKPWDNFRAANLEVYLISPNKKISI